jgi:3-hydroxybutyryl-CoA dehydrogenase
MYILEDIKTIGIAGGGVMGHGVATVAAQAGYSVILYDLWADTLKKAQAHIERFTAKSVEKGKLDEAGREQLLGRIVYTSDVEQLGGELILEAIPEKLDLKQELFATLEDNLPPETIFATNTSSIPVTQIAAGLKDPSRLVGMHFFNPAPIMKLVEVVAGEATAPELPPLIAELARKLGKVPAEVTDTPGFIVNRVARFFYLESLKLLEENAASAGEIDRLMEASGFRMGPFRLMDLIGIETNHSVTQSLYESFYHEPRFRPSRIQQKKVEAGHHGRKTGRGFYAYDH